MLALDELWNRLNNRFSNGYLCAMLSGEITEAGIDFITRINPRVPCVYTMWRTHNGVRDEAASLNHQPLEYDLDGYQVLRDEEHLLILVNHKCLTDQLVFIGRSHPTFLEKVRAHVGE